LALDVSATLLSKTLDEQALRETSVFEIAVIEMVVRFNEAIAMRDHISSVAVCNPTDVETSPPRLNPIFCVLKPT